MSSNTKSRWRNMRTEESSEVERVLRTQFRRTDAYRYNSASIRVRVVDDRFKGKSAEKRDAMVEPLLRTLSEDLQSEIMNLITLYPGETKVSLQARLANAEFEDPSPSRL